LQSPVAQQSPGFFVIISLVLPYNAIHPETRAAWRAWLKSHHTRPEGVWLVSWKKATGKPRFEYDAAVEEALCFGWVDSKPAKLDDERAMLWFAPRKVHPGMDPVSENASHTRAPHRRNSHACSPQRTREPVAAQGRQITRQENALSRSTPAAACPAAACYAAAGRRCNAHHRAQGSFVLVH
jgi:hypothetical protein